MTTQRETPMTMCWKCNESYPPGDAKCPKCNAHNANVNTDAAMFQQQVFELEREVTALTAQLAEARRDAERYKWLRSRSWGGSGSYFFKGPTYNGKETLDAAIDAAMKEPK